MKVKEVVLDGQMKLQPGRLHGLSVLLTLLMKSGAMSGVLLNSPHTCRSLTQQMASLKFANVWDPVINKVMWGLTYLN